MSKYEFKRRLKRLIAEYDFEPGKVRCDETKAEVWLKWYVDEIPTQCIAELFLENVSDDWFVANMLALLSRCDGVWHLKYVKQVVIAGLKWNDVVVNERAIRCVEHWIEEEDVYTDSAWVRTVIEQLEKLDSEYALFDGYAAEIAFDLDRRAKGRIAGPRP